MKQHFLLTGILSLLTLNSIAQSVRLVGRSDSVFYSGSYVMQNSTHYTYSSGRDLLHAESGERIGQWSENLIWAPDEEVFMNMGTNSIRYGYEYDSDGRVTRSYGAGWNGVAWDTGSVAIYHYTNGICDTTFIHEWMGVGQAPEPMSKEIRTYGTDGLLSNELQLWNSNINAYENEKKVVNTYLSGKLVEVYITTWNGTTYAPYALTTYSYTGDNLDTTTNTYYSGGWVNSSQEIYTYDVNDDVIVTLTRGWQNNAWETTHRWNMAYDSEHNMLSLMEEEWTGSAWKNIFLQNHTYTGANYVETITTLPWNSLSGQFMPQQGSGKMRYYYETFDPASVNVAKKNSTFLQVYPNPTSGTINISLLAAQSKPFSLTIYDATGKSVQHWNEAPTSMYSKQVDVSNLPSGNYFLRIDNQPQEMVKFTITQ